MATPVIESDKIGLFKDMQLNNSYYNLGADFYKQQPRSQVKDFELIIYNHKLAEELQLNLANDNLANIFSGNQLLPNSKPIATVYAGHQFGRFVPQLGDGRATLLGELKYKNQLVDIQLKGAGKTFFSRNGDGKYPLDAAIKEYIFSEAMHYLKVPTTRALALVRLDEFIQREELMPASIMTRVASSHIRVGTFEYFAAKGDIKNLKILADYAIQRHFPEYLTQDNPYICLLKKVIELQANLISSWISLGFIHGVMNTDNTSISGQTIDYGPCAFMDEYESDKCFSYIDTIGRYSFSNQKNIIFWNLIKFAEAILPLIDPDIKTAEVMVEEELKAFPALLDELYFTKMLSKIGIFNFNNSQEDKNLITTFLNILEKNKIDFTNGFRVLSKVLVKEAVFYTQDQEYLDWHTNLLQRLAEQKKDFNNVAEEMNKINPILIPRNHIVADIIFKAVRENNYTELKLFLSAIEKPFTENKEYQKYYVTPAEDERVIYTFCGT